MLFADIDMVPKLGIQSHKRLPLPSTTDWDTVRDRLVRAMGYDQDEEADVSMSYRSGNETKSSLEDDDDYQGIVQVVTPEISIRISGIDDSLVDRDKLGRVILKYAI
jgi:hypothetical protein